MSTRVLVTGATGFVGSVLCDMLGRAGYLVRAAVRSERPITSSTVETAVVGEIGSQTDWSAALDGVSCVVHSAARVHVMHDSQANAELYLETNARGTARLAAAAARAGVQRLIYLSSIKVNGEETDGRGYSCVDAPAPLDAYGASKWQAEQELQHVASGTALQFGIVRPPLVYGPGVRANFLRLMRWVDKELPLPLGAVDNERSLVSVWNLCDLIARLLTAPETNRTWMVSDGQDLSTPELIRRLARAMNKRARLAPIPVSLLVAAGKMLGKGDEVRRLCGSLAVDTSATRRDLQWSAPLSVDEGLARTVGWFIREGR